MSLKKWFRNQIAGLSIAFSNVEKNFLNQEGKSLSDDANQERNLQQGTLADSLLRGEITQEVKDLRWRTYKILKNKEFLKLKLVGEDKNRLIFETVSESRKKRSNRIMIDNLDPYHLEMVFTNNGISLGVGDVVNNDSVSASDYFATNKQERPIKIERTFFPKFYIENYTTKINIRTIDDKNKLIEFYISKYPDEYNLNSKMLINELKKIVENQLLNTKFLEFNEVGFITDNTLGVADNLLFTYKKIKFNKIIEFDGFYVIKFNGVVDVAGEDILLKYIEPELEVKYKNKKGKKTIYGGP